MPWVICLGNPVTRNVSKKTSDNISDARRSITFTIIERVPIHRAEHKGVWDALRACGTRQLFIDADHPEEAMPADVVNVADLKGERLVSIEAALVTARRMALREEASRRDNGPLAKLLDRTFEEQREWLSIRTLLAHSIIRPFGSRRIEPKAASRRKRVLILVEA